MSLHRFLVSAVGVLIWVDVTSVAAQTSAPPVPPQPPEQAPSGQAPAAQVTPDGGDPDAGLGDIVVTAQRREERLQRVPVSISAVDSKTVERRIILSAADLPSVAPGLQVSSQSGYSRIYIRGVGSGSISSGQDPSVSLQLDGVVIGRPFAQLANFFDLQRVEVLRGPQGTLYGRNATGGTINVVTRSPTRELAGYLNATYGNYNALQLEGALSGPLDKAGDVRGRIAFQRIKRDGYGRNRTLNYDISDQDSWAVRGVLEIDPVENVDIRITADYSQEDDRNYPFTGFGPYRSDTPLTGVALGGTTLINSRDVTEDAGTSNNRKFWGVSATIGVDLSDRFRVQTILGYRSSDRNNQGDVDTTSADPTSRLLTFERAKQVSGELQLLYTSDRLNGVVGTFYFKEDLDSLTDLGFPAAGRALGFPAATFRPAGILNVEAYAAFTQWTYEVVDGLRLTAGIRYSHEQRDTQGSFTIFNFRPPPAATNLVIPVRSNGAWNALTPRFVIDYTPVKDVLIYASATRGFKSGVLLIGSTNPPVDPEYIWSYEAGIKSTILDKRLRLNATGFYYDFSNLQVNRVVNNTVITENAATASVKGIEVEVRANPISGLLIDADLTYLDAKYGSYSTQNPARPELGTLDLSGNRLPNAPRWTVSGGIEVDIPIGVPGRVSARGDVRYASRLFFTEFNENRLSQNKVATVDASLQYESANDKWRGGLFVRNLTDKDIRANMLVAAAATGFAINGSYNAPRTYGVRLGYKF